MNPNTTKSTTTTAASEAEATAPDLAAALTAGTVTIEAIDPATAQLDPNVRQNPEYTDDLLESIRAEGVREPVHARRGEDGIVYVWDGQRRLLAARDAGTPAILAVFGLRPDTTATGELLLDQLRTFNRADLSLSDRIAAYEQLAFEGITVATIARAAGARKDDVTASLTVAKSTAAKTAAASGQLTLDRLILIAEFDDDDDAALQIATCDDDDLPYVAQEIRDNKATRAAEQALVAEYEAQNITVFTNGTGEFIGLSRLTDAADDADDRLALTADTHADCEGRAVSLRVWGAGEGDHRADEVCTRPDLHRNLYGARATSTLAGESDEAREARQNAEAEAASEERRRVLRNNKAWRTAATVRTDWVTTFLTRKKLPTDAAAFITVTLTKHMNALSHYGSDSNLPQFLGLGETHYGRRDAGKIVETTPTRAGQVNLAIALAAHEANITDVHSWRGNSSSAAVYLPMLEKWGYKLSPVERTAAGYPDVTSDTDKTERAVAEADADE